MSETPMFTETVTTTEPEKAPKSLVCKLAEIVAEIDHVEKKGRNEFHKYDYVKAADLAWAVRKKLSERKVLLLSDVIEQRQDKHGDFLFTTIDVLYTFYDGESGEKLCFKVPGTGSDKGDKGLYKAITGSLKYAIRNAFLVPDDSDPEGDPTVDKEAGKSAAAAVAARKVAAASGAKPQTYSRAVFLKREVLADSGPMLILSGYLVEIKDFLAGCFGYEHPENKRMWVIAEDYEAELNAICAEKKLDLIEGSAPAGGAAVSSPSPQATAAPLITDYKQPTGQKFAVVTWNGMECSCWDAALWPFLKIGKGKPAELDIQDKPKDDKVYHNVVGIKSIGGKRFDMELKNFEIQRGES